MAASTSALPRRRPSAGLLDLSNELLRDMLDCIEADPEKLVSLDRRAYLSVESFSVPPKAPPNAQQTIGNFRLTCKRFADLGAIHQFARVTTRFSLKGLTRLDGIASQPHLAKHVKKFSYMVPNFYVEGREHVRELIPSLPNGIGPLNVQRFVSKVNEQKRIVATELDARVLEKSIAAFSSLQHVQILRVQDEEDGRLLGYIRQHADLAQLVELKWAPACSHCTKTIGAAMLAAKSPCTRFSSPMLSPTSAMALAHSPPGSFTRLMERLTCLELHFDDGFELDAKMQELSGLFKQVFEAAVNMQAVHIGFPSHRPLTLSLEELFHGVRWEKLLAFGIQAWRLDAAEIIALAARHRERLKGLRLRDVLLKEGSMWKDVLGWLRENMPRLEWVSLRRIGYAKQFDAQWAAAGVEVPDDPPGAASDSDSDSDDEDNFDMPGSEDGNEGSADVDMADVGGHQQQPLHNQHQLPLIHVTQNHAQQHQQYPPHHHFHQAHPPHPPHHPHDDLASIFNSDHAASDSDSDDGHSSAASDENGPHAHNIDFPPLSPDTPNSVPWCNCANNSAGPGRPGARRTYPDSAEELGDNGVFVGNQQRKMWEKWVVRRCPEHSCK